ncbi:hypothetical protein J6Z19_01135 [bacterium]|nr:hypothetical protein [bacterium]
MNDMSMLEKILGKFLTREQIVALTEEIARGVNFLNSIIDGNEKTKAKKEFLVQTFRSIDEMIGKSSKLPASVKLLYDMAKTKTHSLLEPLLAKLVSENDFSDLDDIPDVNPASATQKAGIREQQANAGQPQNGEQGGGRRRRRRHGRNRNGQKPVETLPETSLETLQPAGTSQADTKPEPKPAPKTEPEPKPVSKPEPEPESKPVEMSQENAPAARKPETKSEAKPGRRTRKTDSKKPADETKPAPEPESKPKPVEASHETSQHNEPAPEKRRPRRKPKQNAE